MSNLIEEKRKWDLIKSARKSQMDKYEIKTVNEN